MKRQGAELDEGPLIQAISDFIERELGRLENIHSENKGMQAPTAELDRIFRAALQEAWNGAQESTKVDFVFLWL